MAFFEVDSTVVLSIIELLNAIAARIQFARCQKLTSEP